MTFKTTEYKNYTITQRVDIKSHCATIYKGKEIFKMIAGDIDMRTDTHNALEKSKKFIDSI